MFNDHYKRELRLLRELATEFAGRNPQLAGLLRGQSADPDVERLLEGTAFLAADVRQKLDDEFPEIIHALAQAVCPQHLRPIPSATIVAFTPRPNLKQALRIPAGTHLDSVPVDGTACRFRTCYEVEVAPLRVTAVERAATGQGSAEHAIRVRIEAGGVALENIRQDKLRFYLGGDFVEACDLYALLLHHLEEIRVESAAGTTLLPAEALSALGFGRDQQLLPRPPNALPAFGVLQEYFLFREKFLFVELDLAACKRAGTRLDIVFCFKPHAIPLPPLSRERFVLHASPAVNLFAHEAEPLILDQRHAELPLRPVGEAVQETWIFSVDRVEGIPRGAAAKREYRPFAGFRRGGEPTYDTRLRPAPLGEGIEVFMSCALPPEQPLLDKEVLKAQLTCCNGRRPEALAPGDLRVPTRDTPELVDFTNLTTPTAARLPPLGDALLWHLVAHLSLNYLSLADGNNLKAMLRHYAGSGARARDVANHKRIDAIVGLEVKGEERLFGNSFVRGQHLSLRWQADDFEGAGDRYLFGCVLNRFFASCAALNSYTALSAEDAASGARLQWAPLIGRRPLL